MAEQRVYGPVVRLWVWTSKGPTCRRVLRDDLPELTEYLATTDAQGWWVTEVGCEGP